MKKVLKIIGIAVLVLIVAGTAFLKILGNAPSPTSGYWRKIQAGGKIEAEYLENGPCKTLYYEEKALQVFEKYEIWYPSGLEDLNNTTLQLYK